jgi:L-fuconolactonase
LTERSKEPVDEQRGETDSLRRSRAGGLGGRDAATPQLSIDSHQHFWRYSATAYPWIDDGKAALKRDFLPAELAPLLAGSGMAGCVAVQASQTLDDTRFLLDLADGHAFIRGVVGWVDLRSADVEAQLQTFTARKSFKGVRHIVQDEPDDRFLLRDDVLNGISVLESFGLTYDLLVYPRQLPAARELVRRFPRQRFVLDHLGKPAVADRSISPWREEVRGLAASPNVYCKLSGLVTEASWTAWKPDDLRPYLDIALEAFGPDRCMIGSDWPVCTLAGSYEAVMGVVRDHVSRLAPAAQVAVLGGTATRFYGLEG